MLNTAPSISLRKEQQLPPHNNWDIWVVCAGRGFGKTLTGAMAINHLMSSGQYKSVGIIGATLIDVRNVMIEGVSGILNTNSKIKYQSSNRKLIWPGKGEGRGFGGEHYNKLRGYQFDLIWIDEFAKINNAEELWHQINFCLRLGEKAKIIITTTPRNLQILKDIMNLPNTIVTKGSSYHNKENLSKVFFQNIQKYENSFLGHQEIHGQIISDNHLWRKHDIQYISKNSRVCESQSIHKQDSTHCSSNIHAGAAHRQNTDSNELIINQIEVDTAIKEYVIGVDPAFGGDCETGIILAGVTEDEKYIVMEDFSGTYKPEYWIQTVKELALKLNATISVEINHGGNLIKDLFKGFKVVEQRAYINKYSRSIPCYLLYTKQQVLHHHSLPALENQMCNFNNSKKDRVDALVWGLHYLHNRYNLSCKYFEFF